MTNSLAGQDLPPVQVEVRPAEELTEAEQRAVEELGGGDLNVHPLLAQLEWAPAHWRVLVRAGGKVVSGLKLVEREVWVGQRRVPVVGVGDVATLPAWRHRGLASLALARAGEFICHQSSARFGLLFCAGNLLGFYQRLGWRRVAGPTFVQAPWGKVRFPEETMILECGSEEWPPGEIDLEGLPW
ncbi:MAG: GNAT family N-acetyltransferase [Anaerolineae bacterium]|nr:GNAT family N-acetyltransferase [Anaerolineae bacterium]